MGQIDEWFFRSLAGIQPVEGEPGMKDMVITPQPVGDLSAVTASTHTIYGKVSVDWKREGNTFVIEVRIPVGCTAKVMMPNGDNHSVGSGIHSFTCDYNN